MSTREWILTNRMGGYAIGYGDFINKRKYSGLLIASQGGLKRVHTLGCIEELVETGGGAFHLDSSHYPDTIYPKGFMNLCRSWLRPYPAALYSSVPIDENYLIVRELYMVQGVNAVVVRYSNVGKSGVAITLRPKFTLRDHHTINYPGTWDQARTECVVKDDSFSFERCDSSLRAYGYMDETDIIQEHIIFRSVYYPYEATRGYDSVEDLVSPVRMRFALNPDKQKCALFSLGEIDDPKAAIKSAIRFYEDLPLPNDRAKKSHYYKISFEDTNELLFNPKDYKKTLKFAASDFIVNDSDVVAGYPWFGTWGRDTMISLGGVGALPKGCDIAVKILKKYGGTIRDGVLPNTFGEGGEGMNYDSVDSALWYVIRCNEFAPDDKELFANCSRIVGNYARSTSNPFFMADDGLIEIRNCGSSLTWMDAKVYDTPVTPRYGKPIEINALWYNAICSLLAMCKKRGEKMIDFGGGQITVDELMALKDKVRASMQKFVGSEGVADRLEYCDNPVWELRPNAVIALSLPFDFTDAAVFKAAWHAAKDRLLTPYGLRTLDPSNPAFKQMYIGNQKQRDLAYHQGTVWAFLLLPFAKLTVKAFKDEKKNDEIKKMIAGFIWNFRDQMMRGKMASIAEVWDGGDPHQGKGCPAQAWSVFAVLEIERMIE